MSNTEIVDILELTAKLMELHEADSFKTKTYQAAAFNLDKTTEDLSQLSFLELLKLPGVGKSIAQKIQEIVETGRLQDLDDLLAKTPEGVLTMFRIKGIGTKKIRMIWQELGIDTLQGLRQACENGQIANMKGFGYKTQLMILESLVFFESQFGKLRMDKADALAQFLQEELLKEFSRVAITGQVRRRMEEVDTIQLLVSTYHPVAALENLTVLSYLEQNEIESTPFTWRGKADGYDVPIEILTASPTEFDRKVFIYSAAEKHLATPTTSGQSLLQLALAQPVDSETTIYERAGLPYIVPEMREGNQEFDWAYRHQPEELITWENLQGILHNHSTYSDGKHTLEQMATYCRDLGFSYFGIADHSQSASYAGGLSPERIRQQHEEIDRLNTQFGTSFQIFKGIESDILGDGSLDYEEDILASFDYVVASIHQNLTMNLGKATTRLIKAIENPYTTILGHPTGRLLLARAGYPIDHRAVIDACAMHGVVIELNASPYRLDLDWRWIPYALERGVLVSINPDAHEMAGFHNMNYGLAIGRKGGLTKAMTFNALTLDQLKAHWQIRKTKLLEKR